MEISTSSIFSTISVASKLLKLYEKGNTVSLEEAQTLVRQIGATPASSEHIIKDVFRKDQLFMNIKYLLYRQLDEAALGELDSDLSPLKRSEKTLKNVTLQKQEITFQSVFKRIDIVSREARYIAMEVDILEVQQTTPVQLEAKLSSIPLRKLYKLFIKDTKSNKFVRLTLFVKNIILLQDMILLLLSEILTLTKKVKTELEAEIMMDDVNKSSSDQTFRCSKESNKSALSSGIRAFIRRKDTMDSTNEDLQIVGRSGPIIPSDFDFTNTKGRSSQSDPWKKDKQQGKKLGGGNFENCCFHL